MRTIFVIGMGAGDPDYLTLQAVKALGAVDVFFVPDKGDEKSDLKNARHDLLKRHLGPEGYRVAEILVPERDRTPSDYDATVADWHKRLADAYAHEVAKLRDGENGGFLVWGDPSLYDSTLRILETVKATGIDFNVEVIPGISSVHALCARHRIPLNAIGAPVLMTTGRRLGARLPPDVGTVVVLLDGEEAFTRLEDDDVSIFWGAYLGTADEILLSGRLGDMKQTILSERAKARSRKGWIMDAYLLRPDVTRSGTQTKLPHSSIEGSEQCGDFS